MATVFYIGAVQAIPQVDRLTVSAVATAAILTATVNGKSVRYTCQAGETTATAAAALLNAWNSAQDGELRELDIAIDPANASALLVTGPSDGMPFTLTSVGSGGGTITRTAVTTSTGPFHADAVGNYSTGALPSATDTLVFQDGLNGPKYVLTALSAIALAKVRRVASFGGQIGLPPFNGNGYTEYRPQFLQLNSAIVEMQQSVNDSAYQIRFQSVTTACAVTVSGSQTSSASEPVIELHGLPATSTVNCAGAAVGVALRAGQTALGAGLYAADSSLFLGSGSTFTAIEATNCAGVIACVFSTCRIAGNSNVTFTGVSGSSLGSGVGLTIDGGTVTWQSSAKPAPEVTVASGATFDLGFAPSLLPAFTLNLYRSCTVNDVAGRISVPHTVNYVRCDPSTVSYTDAAGRSHAVS